MISGGIVSNKLGGKTREMKEGLSLNTIKEKGGHIVPGKTQGSKKRREKNKTLKVFRRKACVYICGETQRIQVKSRKGEKPIGKLNWGLIYKSLLTCFQEKRRPDKRNWRKGKAVNGDAASSAYSLSQSEFGGPIAREVFYGLIEGRKNCRWFGSGTLKE